MPSSLGSNPGHLTWISVVFHMYTTMETVTALYCPVLASMHPLPRHPLQLLSNQPPSSCLVCRSCLQFTSMPSPHTICMEEFQIFTGNVDLLHTNFKSVVKTRPEIWLACVQFTSTVWHKMQWCTVQISQVQNPQNCSSQALR